MIIRHIIRTHNRIVQTNAKISQKKKNIKRPLRSKYIRLIHSSEIRRTDSLDFLELAIEI